MCSTVLPKPMPGSTQIRASSMPAANRRLDALGEEGAHVVDDVVVARVVLHRPRAALHVHEDDGAVRARRRAPASSGSRAQRGDVVDDRRPGVERRFGDRGLRGVDRDRDPGARRGPRAPRPRARCARARARRVTAAAPGRVVSPPMSSRSAPSAASSRPWAIADARVEEQAAVGERVGRHVDDPHQLRRRPLAASLIARACRDGEEDEGGAAHPPYRRAGTDAS